MTFQGFSRQVSTDALSPGANLAFLQIFMTSAQVEASFLFLFDLKRPEGPGDYGRRYLWAASASMLRPCYRWKAFCLQILALTPLKAASKASKSHPCTAPQLRFSASLTRRLWPLLHLTVKLPCQGVRLIDTAHLHANAHGVVVCASRRLIDSRLCARSLFGIAWKVA